MEVTLTLPFLLTLGTVVVGVVGYVFNLKGELKDQRRETQETKTMVAGIAPKLVDTLDQVAKVCGEVLAWKEADHKALEDVKRRTNRHTKRLDALEKQRQDELLEELREAGVPQSLTSKLETVGSWQAHELSGEHVAAKSTV
jgi:chaperonin cofactor prefoldin